MTTRTRLHTSVYNLGPVSRLPLGEGRIFQVDHTAVAIFRTRGGEVFATQASCPHRGGPLADGLVGAGKVICPLHSYKFDLATGEPVGNACEALKTYPVSVSETGDILLSLPRPADAAAASHTCHGRGKPHPRDEEGPLRSPWGTQRSCREKR